jgi:hypothetical protein
MRNNASDSGGGKTSARKHKSGFQHTHGGKDPDASSEFHGMNKKHGTPHGMGPTQEEYDCDNCGTGGGDCASME